MQNLFSHILNSAFTRKKVSQKITHKNQQPILVTYAFSLQCALKCLLPFKERNILSSALRCVTSQYYFQFVYVLYHGNFINHKFQNHWNIYISHCQKSLLLFYYSKPYAVRNLLPLNFNIFNYFPLCNMSLVGHSKSPTKNEAGMGEFKEITLIHKYMFRRCLSHQ